MNALLPGNDTPLERHAAQALAYIQHVPIPLRQLCNPGTCPVGLLPYLAWMLALVGSFITVAPNAWVSSPPAF